MSDAAFATTSTPNGTHAGGTSATFIAATPPIATTICVVATTTDRHDDSAMWSMRRRWSWIGDRNVARAHVIASGGSTSRGRSAGAISTHREVTAAASAETTAPRTRLTRSSGSWCPRG